MTLANWESNFGKIKLQGVAGHYDGTPAKDLRPGDVLMWNGGYTSTVVRSEKSTSGKTYTITTVDDRSGKEYQRKTTAGRLFVVIKKGS